MGDIKSPVRRREWREPESGAIGGILPLPLFVGETIVWAGAAWEFKLRLKPERLIGSVERFERRSPADVEDEIIDDDGGSGLSESGAL